MSMSVTVPCILTSHEARQKTAGSTKKEGKEERASAET